MTRPDRPDPSIVYVLGADGRHRDLRRATGDAERDRRLFREERPRR